MGKGAGKGGDDTELRQRSGPAVDCFAHAGGEFYAPLRFDPLLREQDEDGPLLVGGRKFDIRMFVLDSAVGEWIVPPPPLPPLSWCGSS